MNQLKVGDFMKIKLLFMGFSIFLLSLTAVFADTINTDDLDKGIVKIQHNATEKVAHRVMIVKGDQKITYPFFADGRVEAFPLQLGNGTYTVGLLKNVGDKRYVYVEQKKVELNLKDPNVVYLNSVQNVKWQSKDAPIVYGSKLLDKIKKPEDKLNKIYGFMVDSVKYDYEKISGLTTEYVPNINDTYKSLTGICYDYSALLASIQRSQGVPTRLVKGYSKFVEGYHAWNEVYIDGKWIIIDSTVDATSKGSKIQMAKSSKDYTKVYDY